MSTVPPKLRLVALLAAMALVLAACGGGASTPPAPTQAAQQPAAAQPTAAPAAEQPTAAPAAEGRVFKVWHYEGADSAMGASWDDALKDFQAKHPDVKVEFERKTFDQIQQTGQMILNSNDVP